MDTFLTGSKRTLDDSETSTSAQADVVPKIKSRKYSQEYLNFGFTNTEVNDKERLLCVICSKILAADSMEPNKHLETLHREYINKTREFFEFKLKSYEKQKSCFKKTFSFHARCKKPHDIGEELVLSAAIEIVQTMFGDNFAKQLQSIPLSNDTVARRIGDIAEDVQHQLFKKLRDKFNKNAHLIAYVRFCDGTSAIEELLFCKPIELKATALALFNILNDFINEGNIEWKNCVRIWCSYNVWKIPNYTSTCKTEISTMYLDTLYDSPRSSDFQGNKPWYEYCANDSCNCSKLYKNDTLKIQTLFCSL
ncbi:hypothetical protein RN001_016016 [Aquatica leii]|uniref:SCAN domain-containing protein 3 n=1 Tax=Aquatica leii TaxID=1421715 RepID=A0AAN7SB20_9COLE|nr:hypothetical protein RN001_016016 [Aquatica leii]